MNEQREHTMRTNVNPVKLETPTTTTLGGQSESKVKVEHEDKENIGGDNDEFRRKDTGDKRKAWPFFNVLRKYKKEKTGREVKPKPKVAKTSFAHQYIAGTPFVVDSFASTNATKHYFLSHFHADHYKGMHFVYFKNKRCQS